MPSRLRTGIHSRSAAVARVACRRHRCKTPSDPLPVSFPASFPAQSASLGALFGETAVSLVRLFAADSVAVRVEVVRIVRADEDGAAYIGTVEVAAS